MDKNAVLLIAFLWLLLTPQTAFCQDPHLFLGPNDIAERNAIANREPWAGAARNQMMQVANSFPDAYNKRYGLATFAVPTEGGQWLHWYVCPDNRLRRLLSSPSSTIQSMKRLTFFGMSV